MTTTTDPHIDLQYSAPSPPQEQAQTITPPEGPLPPPAPTVPQDDRTQSPPPHNALEIHMAQQKQRKMELCKLSKTFGNIPDIPIFTEWENRKDCCDSAVHRSVMAGICGNKRDGAFSVALSCSYKDDEDGGDVIIYTGAGGRERWSNSIPPKRLRLGPQTMDQSWDDSPNRALEVSFLTGNPVRVIRSYKCLSRYAPVRGIRFDGLYKVAAVWTAKGHNGKDICRARLERLPGQPPIPVRELTLSTSRRRRERLVSSPSPSLSPSPSPSPSPFPSNPDDILDDNSFENVPNQHNPSLTQLGRSTGKLEGPSDLQQQQAILETSTDVDFDMDEVNIKVAPPQPQTPRDVVTPSPRALQRYRWSQKTFRLVKVTPPERDEEVCRGEDEATLVPSEDGRLDMVSSIDERMATENLTDRDGSLPLRFWTPDEPRSSGFSALEDQGNH